MSKTGKQVGFGSRPPVVVVLGHVDHGKTTLLDKIRQTNVVGSEAGGITQHIGAYQVTVEPSSRATEGSRGIPYGDKKEILHSAQDDRKTITFIDTPGHAAFSKMRSRGARVADLAVLVVAVDEGVKPQTLESLKYIHQADINYLVALNKIDIPNTNIERVKKLLSEKGIMVEGYGGEVVAVPVSAKTGKGTDELLEMILLLAEMADLKGDPKGKLEAVVIESKLDPRRGPLATVLVRNGSLRVGEVVRVEDSLVKIRAMFNEKGKPVKIALPSQPVEVLGFKTVPPVGGKVITEPLSSVPSKISVPSVIKKESKTESETPESPEKKLKIILKADVAGTLEAIKASLPKDLQIINAEVGEVNESDVLLASATGAQIIAFNVKISPRVKELAEAEKVKITPYKVIYELLEDIEKKVLKAIEPTADEVILGKAEIIAEFEIKKERIAGCRMIEGEIKKVDKLHLLRKEELVGDCRIKSLRSGKRDIESVKGGEEFGVVLLGVDFTIGDVLVSFRKRE
jgi:translation initiation factor IF-2